MEAELKLVEQIKILTLQKHDSAYIKKLLNLTTNQFNNICYRNNIKWIHSSRGKKIGDKDKKPTNA